MSVRYDTLVAALKTRLGPDVLDPIGRGVAFIRRLRSVTAHKFVWSAVLSRFHGGRPGFEAARQCFERLTGKSIQRRAFQVRFKAPSAVHMLERAFAAVIEPWHASARKLRHPLTRLVRDVVLVDTTVVKVHDDLRKPFPGTGKRNGRDEGCALLKVVLATSAFGRVPLYANLVAGSTHDTRLFPPLETFAKGTLLLFDKGFYAHRRLQDIAAAGLHFACAVRRRCNPEVLAIHSAPRRARDAFERGARTLRDLLPRDAKTRGTWDLDVRIGLMTTRLVVVSGPRHRPLAYYTTLPRERFVPAAIAELYRVRWQIELVFKELKQDLNLRSVPTRDEQAAKVFVWASIVALAVSRCVSQWMHPTASRFGLESPARPDMISRAMRSAAGFFLSTIARPTLAALRLLHEFLAPHLRPSRRRADALARATHLATAGP